MMKFNALQFVSTMSADLEGEFNEMEELLQNPEGDANDIRFRYDHLGSLIQGFSYMAEFIESDEDSKELEAVIAQKREIRDSFYPRAASRIYTETLGKKVTVTVTIHADNGKTFEVLVEDHLPKRFHKTEDVTSYIDTLKRGEA